MFCSKCGNHIEPGNSFCCKCGNSIIQKIQSSDKEQKSDGSVKNEVSGKTKTKEKRKIWKKMIFTIAIVLVVFIGIIVKINSFDVLRGYDENTTPMQVASMELFRFDTSLIKNTGNYYGNQEVVWNEKLQIYEYENGEPTGIQVYEYEGGKFLDKKAERTYIYFSEEKNRFESISYIFDIEEKDAIRSLIADKIKKPDSLGYVHMENYMIHIDTNNGLLVVEINIVE